MRRWILLCIMSAIVAGCVGKSEPLNIRRDAYAAILSRSSVGTDEIVDGTLPMIRQGEKASISTVNELSQKCRVWVYVDRKNPMMLHVNTKTTVPCPDCNGSGSRGDWAMLPMRCRTCEGSGKGEDVVKREVYRVMRAELLDGVTDDVPVDEQE